MLRTSFWQFFLTKPLERRPLLTHTVQWKHAFVFRHFSFYPPSTDEVPQRRSISCIRRYPIPETHDLLTRTDNPSAVPITSALIVFPKVRFHSCSFPACVCVGFAEPGLFLERIPHIARLPLSHKRSTCCDRRMSSTMGAEHCITRSLGTFFKG